MKKKEAQEKGIKVNLKRQVLVTNSSIHLFFQNLANLLYSLYLKTVSLY